MTKRIRIEACISSVADAVSAYEGGADRLELNTALSLDGLTPSIGLLREVKEAVPLPIIVMIRPRPFGFNYNRSEFAVMQADIEAFLKEEPAGFAFGILNDAHEIDVSRSRLILQQIKGTEAVFHRAFDVTPAPETAIQILVDMGIHRVLTSGHKPSALEGMSNLKKLQQLAGEDIEILPGSGIKPGNVTSLLTQTGCTQVHGTFRAPHNQETVHGLDVLRADAPPGTSKAVVAEIRAIADSFLLSP